ncbi:MAG: hypothetical protein AAF126_01090 [Chloroflexota bacterium]
MPDGYVNTQPAHAANDDGLVCQIVSLSYGDNLPVVFGNYEEPDVTPEVTPDVTPEVTPDVTPPPTGDDGGCLKFDPNVQSLLDSETPTFHLEARNCDVDQDGQDEAINLNGMSCEVPAGIFIIEDTIDGGFFTNYSLVTNADGSTTLTFDGLVAPNTIPGVLPIGQNFDVYFNGDISGVPDVQDGNPVEALIHCVLIVDEQEDDDANFCLDVRTQNSQLEVNEPPFGPEQCDAINPDDVDQITEPVTSTPEPTVVEPEATPDAVVTEPAVTTPDPTPEPIEPVVTPDYVINPVDVCWIEDPNSNTSAWQVTNPNASPLVQGQQAKVMFDWAVYALGDGTNPATVLQSGMRWDQTGETRINTVLADKIIVRYYVWDNGVMGAVTVVEAFATADNMCESAVVVPDTTPEPTPEVIVPDTTPEPTPEVVVTEEETPAPEQTQAPAPESTEVTQP